MSRHRSIRITLIARAGMAVLGDPVVRLDLRGVGVRAQPQRFDECAAECSASRPRGSAPTCALKLPTAPFILPRMSTRSSRRCAALQPRGDIGDFLADGGGSRGLAVGARQHRQRGVLRAPARAAVRCSARSSGSSTVARAPLQHQRVAEIVDVFRGAAEMHQLQRARRSAPRPPARRARKYSTALTS